jgi:hypothetical protein
MSSLSDRIALVDLDGHPTTVGSKDLIPHDPWANPYWDVWHYNLPPDEMTELEAIRRDELTDLADGPPPIAGGAPTEADLNDLCQWLASIDEGVPDDQVEPAIRAWYADRPSFRDWLDANGGEAV